MTSLHIHVVDDIEHSRRTVCDMLLRMGHRVTESADGESALDSLRTIAPDLLLLDLLMPGVDGFDVTRRVRATATQRWMPVIVMSGLEGDQHFCQALQQGADDYLVRPLNPELLEAKLRHYARVLDLQRQLSASVQRHRDIHDNISDAVMTFDDQGQLLDANYAACKRFGHGHPQHLVGRTCSSLMGVAWSTLLDHAELTLTDVSQRSFPAAISCSEWMEGGDRRVTVVVHDLTEQRAVDRMKDEFLATVSHELRTPLTSVAGAVTLVAAGKAGELPPAARRLLEIADRNARRLGRLIDDLLDLTKIEADRMTVHRRHVSLGPLVDEAVEAHRSYAQRAGVKLASLLAESDRDAGLQVDVDRFQQVMANLVSNAIKHSPEGGTVSLVPTVQPTRVRIAVRDQGAGVPADFQHRMFEKFSQADSSDQRKQPGTGLGLYLSKMLVERMGGAIEAGAAPGGGSEFSVEFPRADRPAGTERPLLWIIDRDVDAIRQVRAWFDTRWRIHAVTQLAAVAPGTESPAAVVADPEGQGSADEFCAGLRGLAAGVPVVLYSDALDAHYVRQQQMQWVPKSGGSAAALEQCLVQDGRALPAPAGRSSGEPA